MGHFNPRSSCEERHSYRLHQRERLGQFQSTLLMRGATSSSLSLIRIQHNFNPRSSCEERRQNLGTSLPYSRFQSTLLMRGATTPMLWSSGVFLFQSTLLMRGATVRVVLWPAEALISIHAPHARSDDFHARYVGANDNISIHAPHARSDGRRQHRRRG